jgi:predicted metal-dependent hydrolase
LTRPADPVQMDLFAAAPAAGHLAVRRSRRAKRLQVRVLPHGHAEVIVPPRATTAEVRDFIEASREWIEKTRMRTMGRGPATDLSLPTRIQLAAAAETWQVSYGAIDGRSRLREEGGSGGGHLLVAGRDPEARSTLRAWLMSRARRLLPDRVDKVARATGLRPAGLSIRRQRTRWGSCTARRRINLNCSALFLGESLLEYLIVHELCHLKHMNHSARFWSLVASIVPDYRRLDTALSESWSVVPGWVFYTP